MRVALYVADQNAHRDRSLGITGYTDGLVRTLSEDQRVELTALASRTSYTPPVGRVETRRLPFATDTMAGRLVTDNLHPFIVRMEADLWHYPKGHLPLVGRTRKPVI